MVGAVRGVPTVRVSFRASRKSPVGTMDYETSGHAVDYRRPMDSDTSRGKAEPVESAAQSSEGTAAELFERWVLPEVGVLMRVAQSMTRHTQDAEDLVQDTMLRAFRSIEGFDGRYPRAWLLTIMRNTEINRHRRRRPFLLTASQMELPDPVADGGATAESEVMDRTFDAVVEEAFEHLSADFREVIELVDIGRLSYAEAAEAAGIPEGTVMSRLHRARRKVRDHLERSGFERGRPR